jgi:hypothetical protein
MSAVSEWIVREYFEAMGFLVHQPRKYAVAARSKRPEEEIDLFVINPQAPTHTVAGTVLWGANELRGVCRAIVSVRGWHTERFSPGLFETSPELFRFAEDDVMKMVAAVLGEGPVARILCLPGLSASDEVKARSQEILKARNIDGVISFPTMLMELIDRIEVTNNYEKSDLLQVLRILKNYDLLKGPQLELFRRKRG